jgi:hypothetical protein
VNKATEALLRELDGDGRARLQRLRAEWRLGQRGRFAATDRPTPAAARLARFRWDFARWLVAHGRLSDGPPAETPTG